MVFTTVNGKTIVAGNVRGPSSVNRNASTTPFSPTNGIAASNVQAAIAELHGDYNTLNTNKADAADVVKVLSGEKITANVEFTMRSDNVAFTAGYFTAAPVVIVIPETSVPQNIYEYTVTNVTTTGFRLWSLRSTTANTTFNWIAVQ